jgi:transcriptional regulator with XRE-family HTH domain
MPDENKESFGDFIYKLRQGRGWTLRELAKQSGISFGRLGEIERGIDAHSGKPFVPSYMAVTRLARAFGLPPADLLRSAGHEPGAELEPEEWDLVGIFRALPKGGRQKLISVARELAAYPHQEG